MAPLAARRVAEMVALGERIVAIELVVGAQATDLRGVRRGRGTEAAVAVVRAVVPYLDTGDSVADVEPLVARVRDGAFAGELVGADSAGSGP
jgi:histidine ammonia-lyase